MTLGEYVYQYITDHNMSMRGFARKADVSHTYITYIVNGKTSRGEPLVPTIDKYRKIARAMGMDVNDLISAVDDGISWGAGKKDSPVLTSEDHELISVFHELNDEGQHKVFVYALDLIDSGKYSKKDSAIGVS